MTALAKITARIMAGDKLHMQFVEGKRTWWFEAPHQVVTDRAAMQILQADNSPIRESGDSLFGLPLNSQTFAGDTP
jgi:hypothetical protein